jgi:hypothetical protein
MPCQFGCDTDNAVLQPVWRACLKFPVRSLEKPISHHGQDLVLFSLHHLGIKGVGGSHYGDDQLIQLVLVGVAYRPPNSILQDIKGVTKCDQGR